jgi:hypothetical protein
MRATMSGALFLLVIASFAQTQRQGPSGTPTIQVKSSLTLVDVIAKDKKSRSGMSEWITTLKRADFRIFDNGREVPIESVDIGADFMTRPIALWLIVQCNEKEQPGFHSMFLRDKTQYLQPALAHLAASDAIGVAHWCDNGNAQLDMLPGHNPDAALAKVEEVLSVKPISGKRRDGELAMQRMIRLALKETQETVPRRLPIFLFLYGDSCGARVDEAESIATDLLETSGMVYGINDGTWPFILNNMMPDRLIPDTGPQTRAYLIHYLVHYYSGRTGGEVYSTSDPKQFSASLDSILSQLHLRYTIGFKPEKLDGKRHILKVSLTAEARKRFPSAELQFRPEYIPAA